MLHLINREKLLRGAVRRVDAIETDLDKLLMRLSLVRHRKQLNVRIFPVVGRFLDPVAVVKQSVSVSHWDVISKVTSGEL